MSARTRQRLASARAHRAALEEARFQGITFRDSLTDAAALRAEWAAAVLRETIAEQQHRTAEAGAA